jgi:hypothetical protein
VALEKNFAANDAKGHPSTQSTKFRRQDFFLLLEAGCGSVAFQARRLASQYFGMDNIAVKLPRSEALRSCAGSTRLFPFLLLSTSCARGSAAKDSISGYFAASLCDIRRIRPARFNCGYPHPASLLTGGTAER